MSKKTKSFHIPSPLLRRIVFALCVLFVCLMTTVLIYVFGKNTYLGHINDKLSAFTHRVSKGIIVKNNKWDISLYISDPKTPHPQGSSGFAMPLYIITREGFIIERNNPIPSYLDATDFSHLKLFVEAKIVNEVTQESWFAKSRILKNKKGNDMGIVMVSIFKPERFQQENLEQKLESALNYLQNNIKEKNRSLDVSSIDIRKIDFDIAFEIVTNYNKTLLNNGRNPAYIDKSLVFDELSKPEFELINNNYAISRKLILDTNHEVAGIIVAGHELQDFHSIAMSLWPYILFTVLSGCILGLIAGKVSGVLHVDVLHRKIRNIIFDIDTGNLLLDDIVISIAKDSYQYHILKILYITPGHRVRSDEIAQSLNISSENKSYRKIYDAVLALNKKLKPFVHEKLITHIQDEFMLNKNLPMTG